MTPQQERDLIAKSLITFSMFAALFIALLLAAGWAAFRSLM
jgi:hypothetical protein